MRKLTEEEIKKRKRGVRFRKRFFNKTQSANGILYWLFDRGIKEESDRHKIVRYYAAKVMNTQTKNLCTLCKMIQTDFPKFMEWYKALEHKAKEEQSN